MSKQKKISSALSKLLAFLISVCIMGATLEFAWSGLWWLGHHAKQRGMIKPGLGDLEAGLGALLLIGIMVLSAGAVLAAAWFVIGLLTVFIELKVFQPIGRWLSRKE